MKKQTEKAFVSTRTIEKDLKTLFQTEDRLSKAIFDEGQPIIDVEAALRLFDHLRVAAPALSRRSKETKWTHPSVVALGAPDPASAILFQARRVVLDAIEQGWEGPPYNPFELAEMRGIKLLATQGVLDAKTEADSQGIFTIHFNPNRSPARMRYSIAHELGHTLFPDCAAATRNRTLHQGMKQDDWQLESLCNMAAAEILMPFGTLQEELSIRPSINLILELRRKYLVSCEAIVNRLIRLSAYPCFAFLARLDEVRSRYLIEYQIPSPSLDENPFLRAGDLLPASTKALACSAIKTQEREEIRDPDSAKWFVEYLGVPPNPGEIHPRILGLAFPSTSMGLSVGEPLRFLRGDATDPFGAETKLLVQIVNDQAQIWGGGFAKQSRKKWPDAQAHFRRWAYERRNLRLGNIHAAKVRDDLTLVSMVAQHGFGKSTSGPRLRYGALFSALESVAKLAKSRSATVHMPRIGAGEAGGSWSVVEGIIKETLISRGINVTIYDLPSRRGEFLRQPSFEFPKELVDEVL